MGFSTNHAILNLAVFAAGMFAGMSFAETRILFVANAHFFRVKASLL